MLLLSEWNRRFDVDVVKIVVDLDFLEGFVVPDHSQRHTYTHTHTHSH